MNTKLFSNTPTVTVLSNRGLTVRDVVYCRHPDSPSATDVYISRHHYCVRGFLAKSSDPRLHDLGRENFTYLTDLAGNVLLLEGVDNGIRVALIDTAGRPVLMVSNISRTDDGRQDNRQAVIRTWQYEEHSLPGRPLSSIEQVFGEAAHITERFVYAGNTYAEKALNLAGQCVSQYDTAGLKQTNSVALTGTLLSVTRQLLKDAENSDNIADWQGEDSSAWNEPLDHEKFTTLTNADAIGLVLTTTDAKGNLQRAIYNIAGQLSGSWLTLRGGKGQVIVKSLSYSAAGQKLREEHGNGVVTTYAYEPQTQRLVRIKTARPAGHASGMKVLQDLRYEYDPTGNVLKVCNDAEETRFWRNQKVVPENTYIYDSLYQLISATGREMANVGQQGSYLLSAIVPLPTDSSAYTSYIRTYQYDNAGNLTKIRHSAPATKNNYTIDITISTRSNRGVLSTLTENAADVEALFTAGGQQGQLQPGQHLSWTLRNELLKVMPVVREGGSADSESYRYDGGSQRLLKVSRQKTNAGTLTRRVLYLPKLELRTTMQANEETENRQVITVGEAGRAQVRVVHRERSRQSGIDDNQIRYSYDTLTGNSSMELDGDGNVISLEEYYPYGGTAVWTVRSQAEANIKTIRYSGKERDVTGLYYYGYRYYQPWVGRWLSADPAGTVDGLNLFRMCRNNPITFKDMNGLQPIDELKGVKNDIDFHMRLAGAVLMAQQDALVQSQYSNYFDNVKYNVRTMGNLPNGLLSPGSFKNPSPPEIDKNQYKDIFLSLSSSEKQAVRRWTALEDEGSSQEFSDAVGINYDSLNYELNKHLYHGYQLDADLMQANKNLLSALDRLPVAKGSLLRIDGYHDAETVPWGNQIIPGDVVTNYPAYMSASDSDVYAQQVLGDAEYDSYAIYYFSWAESPVPLVYGIASLANNESEFLFKPHSFFKVEGIAIARPESGASGYAPNRIGVSLKEVSYEKNIQAKNIHTGRFVNL